MWSLREESSINSRGQNMPRGGRSYAERREKQREQGIGRDGSGDAAFQNEAEESDESEDETAGERTRTKWEEHEAA